MNRANFPQRKRLRLRGEVRMTQKDSSLGAHRGENEAHRDRGEDKAGKGHIQERELILDILQPEGALLQGQDAEVVEVHHHQRPKKEKLGPLGIVTKEDPQILFQDRCKIIPERSPDEPYHAFQNPSPCSSLSPFLCP